MEVMDMLCNACGANIPDNSTFCTTCGAKTVPMPQNSVVPPAPAPNAPQYMGGTMQTYNGYNAPAPMAPPAPMYQSFQDTTPISPLGYIGYNILFNLPFIGLIVALVYAFGSNQNVNVRNYARSVLIIWLIVVVMYVLLFILLAAMGASMSEIFKNSY